MPAEEGMRAGRAEQGAPQQGKPGKGPNKGPLLLVPGAKIIQRDLVE